MCNSYFGVSGRIITRVICLVLGNNNMLIVQYPMQFCGPPRNISDPMFNNTLHKRMVDHLKLLRLHLIL